MELSGNRREIKDKRIKSSRSLLIVVSAGIAIATIMGSVLFVISGTCTYLSHDVERLIETIYISFTGGVPRFLSITVEKNGVDHTLKNGDRLDITYQDEFAVKHVETNSFFMRGITADVSDAGSSDDSGVLLRGIDIIDRLLAEKIKEPKIVVRFFNSTIADIPIDVTILPQDWLRLSQRAQSGSEQIVYLEKALNMKKDDNESRRLLARAYRQAGKVQKAIFAYREILKNNPADLGTLVELSDVYMSTKKYNDAIAVYQKITEINKNDHAAFANAAYASGQLGNWTQAVRYYEKSLMVNPDATDVRYRLAEVYEKLNNNEQAIAQYERIARAFADEKVAILKLAEYYFKSGEYDKAIKYYQGFLAQESRHEAAWANLGLAYGGKGMIEKEIDSYRKSIAINSRNAVVHYNLALALERAGKYDLAEEELRKVLTLKATDSDATEKLAAYYERRKENKKAIDLLKRYAAVSARPEAYIHIARLYSEENDFKNAALNYELAVKHGANASDVAKKMTELKIKMLQKKYGDQ